jgi:hypothetical protein
VGRIKDKGIKGNKEDKGTRKLYPELFSFFILVSPVSRFLLPTPHSLLPHY